jgi:hypothetical protein
MTNPMPSPPTKNLPKQQTAPREAIRVSHVLPWALLAVVVLIGAAWLIHAAFENESARKSTAAEQSAPATQAPPAGAPIAPPAAFVPHQRFDAGSSRQDPHATESVLTAQGPDCLACAKRNGCLDSNAKEGSSCEQVFGNAEGCGPGMTERDACLKTLNDIFESKCASTLQETPCLCGATDVVSCMGGTKTPTGPIYHDYACDFHTTDAVEIERDFVEKTFGAGAANTLVQCVASYDCGCFGK